MLDLVSYTWPYALVFWGVMVWGVLVGDPHRLAA